MRGKETTRDDSLSALHLFGEARDMPVSGVARGGNFAKEPVTDTRRTLRRRTMQHVFAVTVFSDFNLASGKNAVTDRANPLVVDRIPFPFSIRCSQNIESFLRQEMAWHTARETRLRSCAIGGGPDP